MAGAISKSEQGSEGAVVWRFLPACEHDFLGKGFRPSRVWGVPLGARASPVVASLRRGVERRQGGELRQMALVEFISILYEGRVKKTEGNVLIVENCRKLSEIGWRRNMEKTLISQLATAISDKRCYSNMPNKLPGLK